jgi:hypothetical protein
MKEMSNMLIKTGFLPQAITRPEQAMAIILKGRELGIPPMLSLSHISVIQGKPCLDSQLMLSLIYQRVPGCEIVFAYVGDDKCVINARRSRKDELSQFIFTMEDANRMGLSQKPNWKKMPKVMLKWRCVSETARSMFPDAISGAYSVEEMAPDVVVNDDGEVISIPEVLTNQPAAQLPMVYDNVNQKHQQWLASQLEKHNVPAEYWEKAGEVMHGGTKDVFPRFLEYVSKMEQMKEKIPATEAAETQGDT